MYMYYNYNYHYTFNSLHTFSRMSNEINEIIPYMLVFIIGRVRDDFYNDTYGMCTWMLKL